MPRSRGQRERTGSRALAAGTLADGRRRVPIAAGSLASRPARRIGRRERIGIRQAAAARQQRERDENEGNVGSHDRGLPCRRSLLQQGADHISWHYAVSSGGTVRSIRFTGGRITGSTITTSAVTMNAVAM